MLVQKYEGVQALRFVAALAVVVTHSTFYASERLDSSLFVWLQGASGVDIFFVISGFVIVVSSQRETGWIGFGDFLYRRGIRILPPYWVATTINLLVLIALPQLVLHSTLDWGVVLRSYLLIPDLNPDGKVEPLLGVGWTLYFETFFYLAFALALSIGASPIWSVAGLMLLAAASSLWRGSEWPPYLVYLNPIVLEFVVGMLIARFARVWAAPLWVALALATIGFAALFAAPSWLVGPQVFRSGLPAAVIVLSVVLLEPHIGGKSWLRPFVFLGAASYSLYLFHPLLAPLSPVLLSKLGIGNGILSVVLSVGASIAFAAVAYQWGERVFLDEAKQFYGLRRSRRVAASKTSAPTTTSD